MAVRQHRLVAGRRAVDEHRHLIDPDAEELGVERCEAVRDLRRAGGGGDPAPVRVVAEERRLDERRGRDALGDGAATYLTTDLSYDYVRINAEYRS